MVVTDSLGSLAAHPELSAILLDVDGTLAPIVPLPGDARVPDALRTELARLLGRYALVACISGRPADDAAQVVGVPGLRYVGEHGLELAPEADLWVSRLHSFAETVDWPLAELKRLSLSYHYRTAPDQEAAVAELVGIADRATAEGLRPRWGRRVLEIRPPVDFDKGSAVTALLAERGLRRALFAGDDTTDLDAFRALGELEVGVRVAVASEEGPPELCSAADLVVPSPEALADVLRRL